MDCNFYKTKKSAIEEKNMRMVTMPGYKHEVVKTFIKRFDSQYNTVTEYGYTLVLVTK